MIGEVVIGGRVINPSRVVAESIVVTHGRARPGGAAEPGSANVTLLLPAPALPAWQTGNSLTIGHDTDPLFTGRITDLTMTHVQLRELGMCARIRVTAMGPVAALGVRVVGDEPWPAETGAARADRILSLAQVAHTIDGDVDVPVVARDVDAQPALTLLEDLADTTGAAVFDTPDGRVVYQAISGRQTPVVAWMWSDFDPTYRWSDFDPAMTWDGAPPSFADWVSPTGHPPVTLPPGSVEWEPAWTLTEAEVVNHVRVGYGVPPDGGDQLWTEAVDSASIDDHGRRYTYLGTSLATQPAAIDRAAHIISTQARPRWAMSSVVVLLDLFRDTDPTLYGQVLGLLCGDHVIVEGLPQPAPAIDWPAICEGWTYQYWRTEGGQEHERITLALSDPLASLAVITWNDYPSLYTWGQHPTYLTWNNVNTLADLEAA